MIEFTKEELSCIEFCLEQQIELCDHALSHHKNLKKEKLKGLPDDTIKTARESKENCEKLLAKICKHQKEYVTLKTKT